MQLSAHPDFWQLSPEALAEIVNGCGPAGWKGLLVPDNLLGASIKTPCDIHDHRYLVGQTEDDRLVADLEFQTNMLIVVETASTGDDALTEVRRELALRYYAAVRDHGRPYFWADKIPAAGVG